MSLVDVVVLLMCVCLVAFSEESESCSERSPDGTSNQDPVETEEFRNLLIESVKTRLLQKLRMTEPPPVTESTMIPEALLEKYEAYEEDSYSYPEMSSEDDFYGITREIVLYSNKTLAPLCDIHNDTHLESCLLFELTEDITPEVVHSAEFWFHTEGNSSCTCVVSEVTIDSEGGALKTVLATINSDSSNWVKIDINDTVRAWSNRPDSDCILEVKCAACGLKPTSEHEEQEYSPFILVSLDHHEMNTSLRFKRTLVCEGENDNCCLQKFRISFKEIGWHTWIIQPESYVANFCRGSCTNDLVLARNLYTTVLRNYILAKKGNTAAKLCCVPHMMQPLSMIYRDRSNKPKLVFVPNMTVTSCECA